jgi:septum formation protein
MVQRLAKAKAQAVQALRPDSTIVGADTVVICGGLVLGKPESRRAARNMLTQLSGKTHRVLTGLCVLRNRQCRLGVSETKVQFSPLSDLEIEQYLVTGEPFDKAGGYAIQGFASRYVERIDGCYFNVVGLPISLLYQMLLKVGYPLHG